ncbi:MAG: 50S ribosomal protein L5 [Chloroflexi bacterium]|nr:50S ribosomal protein L5 [Chloroflexota bacterium]
MPEVQGSDRLDQGAEKVRAPEEKKQKASRGKAPEGASAPADARAEGEAKSKAARAEARGKQPHKAKEAPVVEGGEAKPKGAKVEAAAAVPGESTGKAPKAAKEGAPGPAEAKARKEAGGPAAAKGKPAAKPAPAVEIVPPPPPRLRQAYRETIVPAMVKEFSYRNVMRAPRLSKIVLHIGMGEALTNPKAIESATRDLVAIGGQRPVSTRAKKSVANFHVRKGQVIGLMTTLRGNRMYEFLDKLINVALPRIRDFRGVPRDAFDGRGNYALGLREQVIFPEIDYNQIDRIRGLQVNVCTTARTDNEGRRLLELLGMPFAKPGAARDEKDGKRPRARRSAPGASPIAAPGGPAAGDGKGT